MLATTSNSRESETQSQPNARLSWRDFYHVHPAAEVFPLLSHDELQKLAGDIGRNGLKIPVQTRAVAGEDGSYVIDGRNRLDAMETLGWQIVNERGEWIGALNNVPGTVGKVEHRLGYTHERIVAEVVAFNIQRRHLRKDEQVELLDRALRAANPNDNAMMARSFSPQQGRRGGSTKGHTGRVVEAAKAIGISERTTKRVLAKQSPRPPCAKPQNRTREEFVVKQFQRFLNKWTVTEQRIVRGILFNFLHRVRQADQPYDS